VRNVQTTAGQVSVDMNAIEEENQAGSSDMEDDDDEAPAPKLVKGRSKKGAVDLYAAEGQYNPKAAKAAAKKAKKDAVVGVGKTGEDYDFAKDFAATADQMVEEGEEEEGSEEGSEEEMED
jgi:hypothetical protein